MRYSMDRSFKTAEKKVREPYFRTKLPLYGLILTTISWHCPFNRLNLDFLAAQIFRDVNCNVKKILHLFKIPLAI
jgi:hypothetical protein